MLLFFTVVTGFLYPVGMTFISLGIFPYQANGSMIEKNGRIVGSELIGQGFMGDKYFQSRPSAIGYNPVPSCGTNWGPTNKRMEDSVIARAVRFRIQNYFSQETSVPKEMLFASSSGVDPHISPESARLQIERIAKARGFNSDQASALKKLVGEFTEGAQLKLFGEPRVNVLMLNLKVDELR